MTMPASDAPLKLPTFCDCESFRYQTLPVFLRACKHTGPLNFELSTIDQRLQPLGQSTPSTISTLLVKNSYLYSIKYDGIRVQLLTGGRVYTKSGHQIPFVHHGLDVPDGHILDAEMVAQPYLVGRTRKTHANVMARLKDHLGTGYEYRLIDVVTLPDQPFQNRYLWLQQRFPDQTVAQSPLKNTSHMQQQLTEASDQGHEGIVVRDASALFYTLRRARNMFKLKS